MHRESIGNFDDFGSCSVKFSSRLPYMVKLELFACEYPKSLVSMAALTLIHLACVEMSSIDKGINY
jgi:hypothetical protein